MTLTGMEKSILVFLLSISDWTATRFTLYSLILVVVNNFVEVRMRSYNMKGEVREDK